MKKNIYVVTIFLFTVSLICLLPSVMIRIMSRASTIDQNVSINYDFQRKLIFVGIVSLALAVGLTVKQIKLDIKQKLCNHHWEGYVFNGAGGSHVWCPKCKFEHYGHVRDKITQRAIKEIKKEKNSVVSVGK